MSPWAFTVLAVGVDLVHAACMAVYFVGLPLLFVHRWPRMSWAYAIYAVGFVVLSQGSQLLLGHCFFTSLAGSFWERSGHPVDVGEWFTVRLANWIFHFAPSERSVSRIGDAAVAITAIGAVWRLRSRATLWQKVMRREGAGGCARVGDD